MEVRLRPKRIEFQVDQSAGQCDLLLERRDGTLVAVEVTSSTDQQLEGTMADLRDKGSVVQAVLCQESWIIHPLPGARNVLIRDQVDSDLHQIAAEGIREFFVPINRTSQAVTRIYEDLRIEAASVIGCSPPPRIFISGPSGPGGIVNPANVNLAVEAEAFKPGNRAKLKASGQHDRHLFVYIHPFNHLPWAAMLHQQIPERPPTLPTEVTHVWAVTDQSGQIVVWFYDRETGWQDLGLIAFPEVESQLLPH